MSALTNEQLPVIKSAHLRLAIRLARLVVEEIEAVEGRRVAPEWYVQDDPASGYWYLTYRLWGDGQTRERKFAEVGW